MINDILLISTDELLSLHAAIGEELKSRALEELEAIEKRRAQLLAFAGQAPANAPAVVDELAEKRERKAGTPKYRNPANPTETWTGRGKKPAWMQKLIEDGKDPEEYRIPTVYDLAA